MLDETVVMCHRERCAVLKNFSDDCLQMLLELQDTLAVMLLRATYLADMSTFRSYSPFTTIVSVRNYQYRPLMHMNVNTVSCVQVVGTTEANT
jgi:hypothetical protein